MKTPHRWHLNLLPAFEKRVLLFALDPSMFLRTGFLTSPALVREESDLFLPLLIKSTGRMESSLLDPNLVIGSSPKKWHLKAWKRRSLGGERPKQESSVESNHSTKHLDWNHQQTDLLKNKAPGRQGIQKTALGPFALLDSGTRKTMLSIQGCQF